MKALNLSLSNRALEQLRSLVQDHAKVREHPDLILTINNQAQFLLQDSPITQEGENHADLDTPAP